MNKRHEEVCRLGGVSGVICDRRTAASMKGRVYRVVVTPVWFGGRAEDDGIFTGSRNESSASERRD